MDRMDPAYRGQKHYTPAFLNTYDVLVLAIYGPLLWWCSTPRLETARITDGPVFRPMDRFHRVQPTRLSDKAWRSS